MLNTEMTIAEVLREVADTCEEWEALVCGAVRFVSHFPCSQSGKAQKVELRARALQQMERREPT
jgi:acyl-coenzyme A synthetase/AMP-(fatty) acid ligase